MNAKAVKLCDDYMRLLRRSQRNPQDLLASQAVEAFEREHEKFLVPKWRRWAGGSAGAVKLDEGKEEQVALVTLEEWKALSPRKQGYVIYMQAELPGSELKHHQKNPYPPGSQQHAEWNEGQMVAVLQAQDDEE